MNNSKVRSKPTIGHVLFNDLVMCQDRLLLQTVVLGLDRNELSFLYEKRLEKKGEVFPVLPHHHN